MAFNTILFKRRLPTPGALAGPPSSLSGGEVAFNEVDTTLYYGASSGIIPIAGSGAFVDRTSNQTISGNKTFVGSTTLSSTTWSANSVVNFSNNVLTNVGSPLLSSDATNKNYVDVQIASVGSSGSGAVAALSAEVYTNFVEKVESEAVVLNGGLTIAQGLTADVLTTTSNATVGGNLTVTGNLSVVGSLTQIDTEVTTTSAFHITNTGTGPALEVTQTGNQPVAVFYDDSNVALYVDGKASTPGYVGIGTGTPNEKLTVSGNISATGNIYGLDIYARNGNFTNTMDISGSTRINNTLSVTNNLSANSNIIGTQYTSYLIDFIIDGGSF